MYSMQHKKKIIIVGIVVVVAVIAACIVESRHGQIAKAPTLSAGSQSGNVATGTTVSPVAANSSSSAMPTTTSSAGAPGLSVSMQRSYAGDSFSFNYPASWSIFNAAPFSITNFRGQYASGDVIPKGGAEIDVVTTTNYGALKNIMATELMGAAHMTTSAPVVSGITCTEENYDRSFSDGTPSANVAVYCERGTELWKIYLSYRANDPAAAHMSDFNEVLSSMQFLPKD